MKDIQELIKNVKKYKKTLLQRKYPSKKNTVAYVIHNNKPRVLKWYAPAFQKNMETEYNVLKEGTSKINMPTPIEIDKDNNILIMSYISGENLCDVINSETVNLDKKLTAIDLLAEWFIDFHKHFKKGKQFYKRGDSILRNYIINNKLYGLDFEEFRKAKPEEDIAGICSSILSTDPMFTPEKTQLCEIFIETYKQKVKWNIENINDEIAYALLMKIQWRPEHEDILRKHAKKIKTKGLR